MSGASDMRRKAWDDAVLLLLYDRELGGEELLAAVIEEANDALARLREAGTIEREASEERP